MYLQLITILKQMGTPAHMKGYVYLQDYTLAAYDVYLSQNTGRSGPSGLLYQRRTTVLSGHHRKSECRFFRTGKSGAEPGDRKLPASHTEGMGGVLYYPDLLAGIRYDLFAVHYLKSSLYDTR